MKATGLAELPLHDGHVPPWMAQYMKKLLKAIIAVIVEEYGPIEVVKRLSNPYWFQALNNAIGMDWDSSGSTTVLTGLLRQVAQENPDLGIVVLGGKGRLARMVPEQARMLASQGLLEKPEEIVEASRIAAKTDNTLLQDGYTIYHHTVIADQEAKLWCIVQQGMNIERRMARRYHWLGPLQGDPTLEPHTGIAGVVEENIIDLTSRKSLEARKTILDLARENPRRTLRLIGEAYRALKRIKPLTTWIPGAREKDTAKLIAVYKPQKTPPIKTIEKTLQKIYEQNPQTIRELVLIEGVGPTTIRSLALVAELVYNTPVSHQDPVNTPLDPFRYTYIVGGKDGIPYPYDTKTAREVIEFLEEAVRRAKLGDKEKLRTLKRLRNLLKTTTT